MHHWDRVWIGANLATLTGGIGIGHIADGALAIREGRIAWIGTREELSRMQWSAPRITEADRHWITPGLIDCHTHLVYAGDRSKEFAARQAGRSYEEIAHAGGGILSTVRDTREVTEEELFEQSVVRARALLAEGVTTLEIKSGYGLDLQTERKMLSVARRIGKHLSIQVVTTFLGAHTVPPEFSGRTNDYVRHLCEDMLPQLAREGLVDAVDVFCERIAFSPAQTRVVFESARSLGLQLRLHADQLSDSGGGELAAELGALSADHLEHASTLSLEKMAARGTVAGLLPGASYYLRDKRVPPVEQLRKLGVPFAIATDCNPGTAPMSSLLLAMNMACVLFGVTPDEALHGVTRNAAKALGLDGDRGTLSIGMRADLAVWRIRHPDQLSAEIAVHRPIEVLVGGKEVG